MGSGSRIRSLRDSGQPPSLTLMFTLGFHIVAVGILILVVGTAAYRMGLREGARRAAIAAEIAAETAAAGESAAESAASGGSAADFAASGGSAGRAPDG